MAPYHGPATVSASDGMWDGSAAVGSGLSAEAKGIVVDQWNGLSIEMVCSFGIARLLFIDVIHLVPDSESAQTCIRNPAI